MKPAIKKMYDANIGDFGNLEPDQLMGLTIYAEARGEIRAGRIGVGTVILERVDHRKWDGESIIDVCLWPYQFSCYLPGDPNRAQLVRIAKDFPFHYRASLALSQCADIARGLIDGTIPRDPELAAANCCQYLTTAAKKGADWWKTMKFIKKIGAHEFYA
jgi:spore germination cell wall hydrolase CwlJ-like protein